jgi:hypothetical protein
MPPSREPDRSPRTRRQTAAQPTRLGRPVPGVRGVRVHHRDGIDVLWVTGRLEDSTGELQRAVHLSLADEPHAIVCDLTDAGTTADRHVLGRVTALGDLVRDWPGTPVGLVAEQPLLGRLRDASPSGGCTLDITLHEALTRVTSLPPTAGGSRRLPPHPTAARAARDFLTDRLLDWRLPKAVAAGSLVMSELVTNAMVYAHGDIDVSVARHDELVRIAVRDEDVGIPQPRQPGLDSAHGRGLLIVDGFARAWGVLPCARGGKVVWAVVEA